MALAFVIIGLISASIYAAVTDNGNNKKAGGILLLVVLILGCVLESIFGNLIGLVVLIILFAGWIFSWFNLFEKVSRKNYKKTFEKANENLLFWVEDYKKPCMVIKNQKRLLHIKRKCDILIM